MVGAVQHPTASELRQPMRNCTWNKNCIQSTESSSSFTPTVCYFTLNLRGLLQRLYLYMTGQFIVLQDWKGFSLRKKTSGKKERFCHLIINYWTWRHKTVQGALVIRGVLLAYLWLVNCVTDFILVIHFCTFKA
jgi:hypothetical protein